MPLKVSTLTGDSMRAWDDFVESHPDSTFFHRAAWRSVLERAFGHETHFLYVEDDGVICGVLPLALVKSLLFGSSLSSSPFCVYGGPLAQSYEATEALIQTACELANRLGVGSLELRCQQPTMTKWPRKELYYTFKKTIDSDHDANMKAIPNKQRAMVRKGVNAGLIGERVSGSERLYKVYSESVRNLGTPVFSQRYFDVLQEEFADDCRVLMIMHEGNDVAGVMSFYFKGEVLPYYGGSIAAARAIKGCNDFMYWELMRRSCDDGLTVFDFGRSKKGTGPYNFKKNWGFEPQLLNYEYYLVKDAEIPEVNPLNPKYRLMVDTWKNLPLPIANFVGPFLARNLG